MFGSGAIAGFEDLSDLGADVPCIEFEKSEDRIQTAQRLQDLASTRCVDLVRLNQGVDGFNIAEKRCHSSGDIKVLVHGTGKAMLDVIKQLIQIGIRLTILDMIQLINAMINSGQRQPGAIQAIQGKGDWLSVMGRKKPVSNQSTRKSHAVEVIQGKTGIIFIHLFAVN